MKISKSKKGSELLTFGGHLEVLRKDAVPRMWIGGLRGSILSFALRKETFKLLLAPSEWILYLSLDRKGHKVLWWWFPF